MKRAILLIRTAVHYRHDGFKNGLEKLGYTVDSAMDNRPADVVVVWNRNGRTHEFCKEQEARGAKILVAENGYLGKDFRGEAWYALARGYHNGAGRWPRQLGSVRAALYAPRPLPRYRVPAAHGSRGVLRGLLLPQRGIGPPGVASPRDWTERVTSAFKRSGLHVQLTTRAHPGVNRATGDGLETALNQCDFCVVWSSGAGIKSLVQGVPVVSTYDRWLGAPAAVPLDEFLQHGMLNVDEEKRQRVIEDVFAAMWRIEEIADGSALAAVLDDHV